MKPTNLEQTPWPTPNKPNRQKSPPKNPRPETKAKCERGRERELTAAVPPPPPWT